MLFILHFMAKYCTVYTIGVLFFSHRVVRVLCDIFWHISNLLTIIDWPTYWSVAGAYPNNYRGANHTYD